MACLDGILFTVVRTYLALGFKSDPQQNFTTSTEFTYYVEGYQCVHEANYLK